MPWGYKQLEAVYSNYFFYLALLFALLCVWIVEKRKWGLSVLVCAVGCDCSVPNVSQSSLSFCCPQYPWNKLQVYMVHSQSSMPFKMFHVHALFSVEAICTQRRKRASERHFKPYRAFSLWMRHREALMKQRNHPTNFSEGLCRVYIVQVHCQQLIQ